MKRVSLVLAALLFAFALPADVGPGPRIAAAAEAQVGVTRIYDARYVSLRFPGGDIPMVRGVCADVVVRAFRTIGVDLQEHVNRDMRRNFAAYPKMWGLSRPDANIDHRRVPNLMKFFERQGKSLPIGGAYAPGDVVAWRLPNGLHHIGVVSRHRGAGDYLVVHNIGAGAQEEDVLRAFTIIGHYRW